MTELVLGLIVLLLLALSGREYFVAGKKITPKLKTWLRVVIIFVIVIVINLLLKNM